jgi:hypothetical protein
MLKKRILFPGVAVVSLVVCAFMGGNMVAQQQTAIPGRALGQQLPIPAEQILPYGFQRSWGGLHSVTTTGAGFAYFFVASDGTVRMVEANAAGIIQINVIQPR